MPRSFTEEQLIQCLFEIRRKNNIPTAKVMKKLDCSPSHSCFSRRFDSLTDLLDRLDMPHNKWVGETPRSLKWKLIFVERHLSDRPLRAADVSEYDELPSASFISDKLGDGSWSEAKREAGLEVVQSKTRGTVTVSCFGCDQEFEKEYNQAERSEKHYFSDDCRMPRESVECDWCGAEMERIPSNVHDRNFCDRFCHGDWLSENRTASDHHQYTERESYECEWCGEEFERLASRAGDRAFCNKDCAGEWRSENIFGKNHPQYKEGYSDFRGANWSQIRRRVRKRDNHKCQNCGVKEENYQHELDVHHKIPFHEFEDAEEANRPSNLISLCRHCHSNVENGNIELD